MDDMTDAAADVPREVPPPRRRRARWILLGVVGAVLLGMALWRPWAESRAMVIVGAGAGRYELITYERHYGYWIDREGRRWVDTTFRVAYFSHARTRDAMLEEARRIAPALWPFADSAGLTRLELKPTRALIVEVIPITFSYDLRFKHQRDGTWTEVQSW